MNAQMGRILVVLVTLVLGFGATNLWADVRIGERHLVILKPGVDTIWGNYIFAVQNDGEEEQRLKALLMLPKETVDYQPQDGLGPDDLVLEDAGIALDKSFPPGLHIISVAFKTDARLGVGPLHFVAPGEIPDFTLLLPKNDPLFVQQGPLTESAVSPDPAYQAFIGSRSFAKDETIALEIGGVPEGRLRYWAIGAATAGLLLLLALVFGLRTRPKVTHESFVIAD